MIKKEKILLILIVVLGLFLRFYKLDKYPGGFNLDEVSQGYTAYSILKTGKDEWGVKYPLAPRAFGDFRSPLYTYLTIPFVAIFGLNELAVRIPAATFGSLSILILYLLVNEFFKDGMLIGKSKIRSGSLALLSALFLAISPWHISLSRGAFEASLNVFFLPLGIWLFIRGLKKWPVLILSGFVFGLNMFSYYSPRFFTPITIIILIIYFKNIFFKNKKNLLFFLIFGIFLLISVQTLIMGGKTRLSDTSILNPTDKWEVLSKRQYEGVWLGLPPYLERVFNNKITATVGKFTKQYLSYFSFHFLFNEGASEYSYGMIAGRGVLYFYELPLLLIMFWSITRNKDKRWIMLLILLMLSPIPASLAKGDRAANRAITMLPFWQIFSAGGLIYLYYFLNKWISRKTINIILIFIFVLSFSFFLEDYLFHAPISSSRSMGYGWKEVSEYLKTNENKYDKIIISGEISEPQIALAFYSKIDPKIVQKESVNWLEYEKRGYLFVDQLPDYFLGKYEFKNLNFPEDKKYKNILFIGKEWDFAGISVQIEKIVYYPGPDKNIAFKLITINANEN